MKIIHLEDILEFGKYKGNSVEFVLEKNPSYLLGVYSYTDIEVSEEVYELAIGQVSLLDWGEDGLRDEWISIH